jgi:hypothetical protein
MRRWEHRTDGRAPRNPLALRRSLPTASRSPTRAHGVRRRLLSSPAIRCTRSRSSSRERSRTAMAATTAQSWSAVKAVISTPTEQRVSSPPSRSGSTRSTDLPQPEPCQREPARFGRTASQAEKATNAGTTSLPRSRQGAIATSSTDSTSAARAQRGSRSSRR